VVAPTCIDLGPRCFGPGRQASFCTDHILGFIGASKLSSLVTALLNHPSLHQGCL
jgi:hypothetical protein